MTERAVGYVRVSSDQQLDGHSLSAQREEIRRYSELKGWELAGIYADEAASAYKDSLANRPQMTEMLNRVEPGMVVVVHSLDRLARNLRVQLDILARLGKQQVGFDSVTEQIDYATPQGRLILSMLGSFNEFFSGQLGMHVKKSQRQRAREGLPSGPVPFGYSSQDGSVPAIVPSERDAVAESFELRGRGSSYQSIADELNRLGFETRRGNPWSYEAVREMLANRFYCGFVIYDGEEYEGAHDALVSADLFLRVQTRRRERAPKARVGTAGALHGRAYCVRCERRLHVDRGYGKYQRGYQYYRERHRYECETRGRSVSSKKVDA
ncbi:MAG: recombinase family protein, partial [Chloroflexi bacterium]|nr:recombinase family protein [Chloroflexota bacterium]